MTRTYRAEQDITISGSETSIETELTMVVTFKVHPGYPGTHVDPPEIPAVEVDSVRFFEVKEGNTAADERMLPDWLAIRHTQGESFENWLMSEASEQAEAARDEAADQRREAQRELDDNEMPGGFN